MKTLFFAISLMSLATQSFAAPCANFTGKWSIDCRDNSGITSYEIVQKNCDAITIDNTTITVDGRPQTLDGASLLAQWDRTFSPEGNHLSINYNLVFQGLKMSMKYTLVQAKDGTQNGSVLATRQLLGLSKSEEEVTQTCTLKKSL